MHFTMNGNCNLCYTVHTCNINVIINDFLLGIMFVISRFHCINHCYLLALCFYTLFPKYNGTLFIVSERKVSETHSVYVA